jgi:superfamily II RNA helicase
MYTMLKGGRTPLTSHMNFHYEFILKTLQSSEPDQPMKWLQIMERSYWHRQHQRAIAELEADIQRVANEIKEKQPKDEEVLKGCQMRAHWEHVIKVTVNAQRREAQKQLDVLKNRQMGPKWNQAITDYQAVRQLEFKHTQLKEDLTKLSAESVGIQQSIKALHVLGYIAHADSSTLTRKDLTLKGTLATEVNEAHPILLTELYTHGAFNGLTATEIITILACFHEYKEETEMAWEDLQLTPRVRDVLNDLDHIAHECTTIDIKYETGQDGYWDISNSMIEPLRMWMEGESSTTICSTYALFEGNFIRSVLKTANMVDELISMTTYCQHVELLNQLMELRQQLVRGVIVSDSLYLHL